MEYRQRGQAGVAVSAIGLGGNTFGRIDANTSARVIHQALDLDINFIDTADTYSHGLSEEYIGRAIADRRDAVILATKTGYPFDEGPNGQGLAYRRIVQQVEGSLRRLGTDYIDVYYLHRPDPRTPIAESLRALDDLVRAGKIRYAACSNYAGWQIAEMVEIADRRGYVPPVVSQSPDNVLDRAIEDEIVPACAHYGLGIVPYGPLAGGFLPGKYRPGSPPPAGTRGAGSERWQRQQLTERRFRALDVLEGFTAEHGLTVGELAVAWLLAQPVICSVITGATKPEQVVANVMAADWLLSPGDLAEIERRLEEADAR